MLFLALMAGAGAADDPFRLAPRVETLPNGLTVLIEEDHRTDTVGLHLHYGVGSRDEKAGEKGCAHLFEHLMFEGSRNVPTNFFDTWLTDAGGWNNAYTSNDETAYIMEFPSGALDLALFLESDRMAYLDAGLTTENLANQKGVVLQERAEGYSSPNGKDWDALDRLGWAPDHPYHVPVIGTVADVEGFSLEAVQSFWKRHYRPDNAVLAIVGHVDPDAALAAVRAWFGEAEASGPKEARVTEQPKLKVPAQRWGLLEDDVEERTVWVSWPAVPLLHPDEAPLEVLAHVLSYGRGTPLDDRLTFSGKANQSNAFQYAAEIDGRFYVVASSDRTPLAALLKIIDQEVRAVQANAPTPEAVERGREALRASMLNELEEPLGRAQAMVDCQRLVGKPDCLGDQFARYAAVTPKDVQRVAQTYLKEETRVLLSVVPRGDRGALKGSSPVELP